MEVVIYARGPHLEKTMRPHLGPTIAINMALDRVPWEVDWLSSGDSRAYDPGVILARPALGFVGMDDIVVRRARASGWTGIAKTWNDLPEMRRIVGASYSITAAYALAAALGATRITVYGADRVLEGKEVIKGRYDPSRRDAEEREHKAFVLNTGIPVERVLWKP